MTHRFITLGIVAALAAGCSTTTTSGSGTPPNADPSSSSDPNDPSGAAKSDGSPAETSASTASGKTGTITIGQTVTDYSAQSYATAFFVDASIPTTTRASCETTTVSGCTVNVCDTTSSDASDASSAKKAPNAGTITITGGSLPSSGLTLEPSGKNGAYAMASLSDVAFESGAALTVSASGGDVPAFEGHSVHAPSDLDVTSPALDPQSPIVLDRSKSLAVAWSDGKDGDVTVSLTTTKVGGGRYAQVQCKTSAASGKASIPAAALAKLDDADGSDVFGSISVSSSSSSSFKAGDYETTFLVVGSPVIGVFTTK
jgi:hypothetical protein